jgi:hypothetical protein
MKKNNDPFADITDHALTILSKSVAPGTWMIDIIPSCEALIFLRFDVPNILSAVKVPE